VRAGTLVACEPGATECSALDALVPVRAAAGERARRMLALAGRKGLGSNTRSIGLGDMGSELAAAFDEAFFDYPGSFWNADWKHSCDYVEAVRKVLSKRFDGLGWAAAIKDAIWNRDQAQRDVLLAQVRVRTKDRFCVAGAWLLDNIEPRPRCAPSSPTGGGAVPRQDPAPKGARGTLVIRIAQPPPA